MVHNNAFFFFLHGLVFCFLNGAPQTSRVKSFCHVQESMKWRLCANLGEFLDLKTFLELRRVERSAHSLYRVNCVYDFIIKTVAVNEKGYCTLARLLSLVGPVRELPFLRIKYDISLPKAPRPKIKHLQIENTDRYSDLRKYIPEETKWLSLKNCNNLWILEPWLDYFELVRLDIEWISHWHLHIPYKLEYLHVTQPRSYVSFCHVDTFEHSPRLQEIFNKKYRSYDDQCWPARHVILHLEECEREANETQTSLRDVIMYCLGVNTRTGILELSCTQYNHQLADLLICFAAKFPNVQILILHCNTLPCVCASSLGLVFEGLIKIYFTRSSHNKNDYDSSQTEQEKDVRIIPSCLSK